MIKNKKFILEIEYECGKAIALTEEPDLQKAILQFQDKVRGLYGVDKSRVLPVILGARVIPVNFDLTQETTIIEK